MKKHCKTLLFTTIGSELQQAWTDIIVAHGSKVTLFNLKAIFVFYMLIFIYCFMLCDNLYIHTNTVRLTEQTQIQ